MNLNHEAHFISILIVYTFSLLLAFSNSLTSFVDIKKKIVTKQLEILFAPIIFIIFCLIFGLRAIDLGTDTSNYVTIYNSQQQGIDTSDRYHLEPIFRAITKVLSYFLSIEGYFIAIAILIFMPICFYLYKVHRSNFAVVTFYLFSLFTSYSFGMNIIRNGLAVGMIFISLLCYKSRQNILCYVFLLIAFFFHSSSLLWIAAFMLIIIFHKIKVKWFFICWLVASVISFSNLINNSFIDQISIFLPGFSSEKLATYTEVTDYRTGFRPDFWLFSFVFVASFFFYRESLKGRFQETLLKLFLTLNSVFILMFFLPYNDRFGLLSYILIPTIGGFIYENKNASTKLALNFFFLFLGIYSIFFQLINAYK